MRNEAILLTFMPVAFLASLLAVRAAPTPQAVDPYEHYVRTSEDFRRVKQDRDWALKAWPSWIYMPWYHQWHIGFEDRAAAFCRKTGYNGAFVDKGKVHNLEWINRNKLRFYMDHTAGKGDLYIKIRAWRGPDAKKHRAMLSSTGLRINPINDRLRQKLKRLIHKHISALEESPYRTAYALDDEISWGSFLAPCSWRITDDDQAYPRWLREVYGEEAPKRDHWFTYEEILGKLPEWSIAEFDASPVMDQWTFNDSVWLNFIGELVEYANAVDPATPCGFVGGQCPNTFGGYDYAKIMRKVQFIESYNYGSSQAIIRSFNPRNALPHVTTHFHRNPAQTAWETWYYLAHGNRGFIGWVKNWFEEVTGAPLPWHEEVAPHYREAGTKIGPLMTGAEWIHDGVAIYYNHASIQLAWVLDAETHAETWYRRGSDSELGSSHQVRHAWESMLLDEGLQYNFLSYAEAIQDGIPREYKVLILPAALCLSDVEARRIRDFCRRGGTVIADYLPGLWDQHGTGRALGGALDGVFGVRHLPDFRAQDIFSSRLWVETDQEANFRWKDYATLLTNRMDNVKDTTGYHKAVRTMPVVRQNRFGKGRAVLMNLSPAWYTAYRVSGFEEATRRRRVFMDPLRRYGVEPWIRITNRGPETHGAEIAYWQKGDRTILFLCLNPERFGALKKGGHACALRTETIPIELRFKRSVRDVRNERKARDLGNGRRFKLDWKTNEALVLSFEGAPPR